MTLLFFMFFGLDWIAGIVLLWLLLKGLDRATNREYYRRIKRERRFLREERREGNVRKRVYTIEMPDVIIKPKR